MAFFDRIMNVLQKKEAESGNGVDLALAKAVILLEVAEYDETFDARERQCIMTLLKSEFQLPDHQIADLLKQAAQMRTEDPDVFYSTREINGSLSVQEKMDFMVQVWKVVLADEKVDYSEDVLTRKLIKLLRLDRGAWLLTRERAKTEIGEHKRDNNK